MGSTIHVLDKRGKSQRQIARELGLSRETVTRALREPVDKKPAKRRRRSAVDPYGDQIRQWLKEGLTTVRMLELARADTALPDATPFAHGPDRAAERRRDFSVQLPGCCPFGNLQSLWEGSSLSTP